MPALFFSIAGSAASNVLQLLAGCLLAIVAYTIFKGRVGETQAGAGLKGLSPQRLLSIALFSLCGSLLPLGIYGVVPILAALLAVGFEKHAAGALLVSNVMFNMLTPGTDPGFIWKTGYRQVIFAIIAGLTAGLLLSIAGRTEMAAVRPAFMPRLREDPFKPRMFLLLADDCFKRLGFLLVAGVIADILFQRYLLGGIVNAFYSSAITEAIPGFFGSRNVADPLFMITFKIIYMLMNMVNLSALCAVLKLRWLMRYYGYYLLWAAVLAVPALI